MVMGACECGVVVDRKGADEVRRRGTDGRERRDRRRQVIDTYDYGDYTLRTATGTTTTTTTTALWPSLAHGTLSSLAYDCSLILPGRRNNHPSETPTRACQAGICPSTQAGT